MHEYHDFHESYYHHTCLIIPEKDVLDTDIIGLGCVPRFKRWWHDLFLLSYTCARTRGFYTSSHAMTIERFRQYRKYRHRIHPMSKFRIFWDMLMLYVIYTNKLVFRFTSSFTFDQIPKFFFYYGAFLELIIIGDLYVNLKSGYIEVEAKQVILDTRKSLLQFCSHKLFLHLAAAIPLHWFLFLRYGSDVTCGLCKANRFNCALKIISVISLYRVFETTENFIQNRRLNHRQCYRFLRIALVGFMCILQFNDLSDTIVLLVSIANGSVALTSTMAQKLIRMYGTGARMPLQKLIIFELSRGHKCLLLFSLGYKARNYYLDMLSTLISYLIANAFYVWSILECYALLNRTVYSKDRISHLRSGAFNLMACRQLPDELRHKLEQYYKFKPTHLNLIEHTNILYKSLPVVLKTEAKLNCYMRVVRLIPFFSNLPLPILKEIVLMLKKEVFLKTDIVADAWSSGEGLMIVDNGVLAVYSTRHVETGHLIDGDYFGELSLVTDKEICMSYVVAITPCTILVLQKAIFRKFMRDYPDLFIDMKKQMKQRFNNPVPSSMRMSLENNHEDEARAEPTNDETAEGNSNRTETTRTQRLSS